jgi:hypothetical protein
MTLDVHSAEDDRPIPNVQRFGQRAYHARCGSTVTRAEMTTDEARVTCPRCRLELEAEAATALRLGVR